VPFKLEINHEWFVGRLKPNPQCWPRFIYGPSDGTLDAIDRQELTSVLVRFTPGTECFFRFAEIPFLATEAPLLFEGLLARLEPFLSRNERYQFGPEYWWPADRSWCVCSDYDLTFTIVGGCSRLYRGLATKRNIGDRRGFLRDSRRFSGPVTCQLRRRTREKCTGRTGMYAPHKRSPGASGLR
jgi:hypothetical protein